MRSFRRATPRVASVAFGVLIVSALAPGMAACQRPPAALSACANAALPPEILDGTFAGSGRPLATLVADGAKVPLTLAVADDENTRDLGLMCVTRLRPHDGMLFVFDGDANQEFWMKNTLIPLDMVWVNERGVVTSVSANVPAATRETPDDAVARRRGYGKYVIELAAGEAARDGVATGVTLHFGSSRP